MNTHIGDKIFHNTPRRVAKFRKNRSRDVEKIWLEIKKKIKRPKYNSLPLSLERYVDDCNNMTKIEQSSLSLTRSQATVI